MNTLEGVPSGHLGWSREPSGTQRAENLLGDKQEVTHSGAKPLEIKWDIDESK